MPFRTKYQIYGRLAAPVLSTTDKTMARVEWYNYLRNLQLHGIHRLVQTVEPVGELTKGEAYLYLVYRVRKAWRKYHDGGRKQEDRDEAQQLDAELDQWNFRTKVYIESHPDYKPRDQQGYDFYVVVQAWRDSWKERSRYSGRMTCDKMVLQEMSRECRQLEKQIDSYIKTKLNLI